MTGNYGNGLERGINRDLDGRMFGLSTKTGNPYGRVCVRASPTLCLHTSSRYWVDEAIQPTALPPDDMSTETLKALLEMTVACICGNGLARGCRRRAVLRNSGRCR